MYRAVSESAPARTTLSFRVGIQYMYCMHTDVWSSLDYVRLVPQDGNMSKTEFVAYHLDKFEKLEVGGTALRISPPLYATAANVSPFSAGRGFYDHHFKAPPKGRRHRGVLPIRHTCTQARDGSAQCCGVPI